MIENEKELIENALEGSDFDQHELADKYSVTKLNLKHYKAHVIISRSCWGVTCAFA